MSYNPWGPRPPYHVPGQPRPHPHAPPAHPSHVPGAYAYVPTPVMLPVYQPAPPPVQPSYAPPPQPAPAPQHHDPIDWVPATGRTAASLSHRALVAGKEGWDGSPLWVIRAHHGGEFVPGKLAIKHKQGYIPYGGNEVPVHNFEVLCVPEHLVHWAAASNGEVPPGAIVAGNTHKAEPLYVCRVRHMKSITPGKVHQSHGFAYISFGGSEIRFKHYEVLCKSNTSTWR